jgi:chaperonin GroEL
MIAENAGFEGSVIVEKVLSEKNPNFGFDAEKGEFVDMMKAGIVDPAKVVRTALENAASIAGYLLTSEVIVTEIPEKKEKSSMPSVPEY